MINSNSGYKVLRRFTFVISFVAITFLTMFVIFGAGADAGSNVVTVYADGYERTIQTEIDTVKQALERADVNVGEFDLVEPAIDTEILEPIFSINVYRARPVTVLDGETTRQIMTPYRSERLIAADAGIVTYPEDRYLLEKVDDIVASGLVGQRMTIVRATPVNIELYGNEIVHRTHADNVGDILEERGISLAEGDRVEPAATAKVKDSTVIRVIHTGTKTVTEEVRIPYDTEYIYDANRMVGDREVSEAGSDGLRLVTFELTIENDIEIARKELQSVVKEPAQRELVIVGTKNPDPSSNIATGQSLAAQKGWVDGEWTCLYNLWVKESQWNHLAENPYSGAYGIPQALPGTKMASHGSDWQTNPATQIAWGLDYIEGRYGTPCGAWNHSVANGWY